MTVRNLLTWNEDDHPRLTGYTVGIVDGASAAVPSAVWLDPNDYADADAAAVPVYTLVSRIGTDGPQPTADFIGEPPVLVLARSLVTPAVCRLTGTLTDVAALARRQTLWFRPHWADLSTVRPTWAHNAGGQTVTTNARGEFNVVLQRNLPIILQTPALGLVWRFVVPDATDAVWNDLVQEPVRLGVNS